MITRTFHPVGQGAFYTEKHQYNDGSKYNVVYDCGSTSLKKVERESRIKSAFTKDEVIDVLFISHFHADHVNAIDFLRKHCKIKTVILPFLSERSKIALRIENSSLFEEEEENDFNLLINNASEYFGPDTITIRINTYNEGNSNEQQTLNITDLKKYDNQILNSAVKFQITEWIYVPFNFEQTDRSLQFGEALKKAGIDFMSLTSIEEVLKNKKKIKDAYAEVNGELNENSMVVYSGPANLNSKTPNVEMYSFNKHYRYINNFSSCLYTGDFNAKSVPNVTALIKFLNQFKMPLGILQIPHHGSRNNFSNQILANYPLICIISVGNYNKYGHPSNNVIDTITQNDRALWLVTESIDSICTQIIRFPK